jgi:hypothetical protein
MKAEYKRCMKDPVYFTKKYCKVISLDRGLVNFELYPYQEEMFKNFNDHRFNIVLACRQSGKSIASVAYLLWYALFKPEQTVAILANKGATSQEMVGRITLMLENIPFFLQPGCKALNRRSIEFSNNSKIISASTSSSSIRGFSINLLYLDEFAFVKNAEEFYTSTYPVVTSGTTSKIIITSTANGVGNRYHKLWQGAIQGTNEYNSFRVDWWDVPGRDEEWKIQQIRNTSQRQFEQEFGNNFLGTGDTLIDGETLNDLRATDPIKKLEKGSLRIFNKPKKGHEYVLVADCAKGRGQDYSAFNIIDVSSDPFEQVATYRNNKISPYLYPTVIEKYATLYNEALAVIEANDIGHLVAKGLYQDLEYENTYIESAIKADKIGVEMNKKVKRIGCSSIKDIIEEGKLILHDKYTINELNTFEKSGYGYAASDGNHDDLAMTLVLFGFFANSTDFEELADIKLRELLYEQRMRDIEEDLPPFGHIPSNGVRAEVERELREKYPIPDWNLERWDDEPLDGIRHDFSNIF